METVGIIAAMTQECRALLKCVGKTERTMLGPFSCYSFQLSGRNCLLVKSGIGIKRAMDATRTLIAEAHPQLLVSFGVAGSARDDLEIGDVVAANQTFLLDKRKEILFQQLDPLSDAAWHAAVRVLERRGARLVSGTAVTTRMSNPVRLLPGELAHPFFDMETAGIAQIAADHGVAIMALRAISDGPLEPLSFDIEAMTDEDFNLSIGKAVKMVILKPQLAFGSLRIIRNVGKAAENAAAALLAMLGQAVILDELKGQVRIPVEFIPLAPGSVDSGLETEGEYL
jgi:adenosylhomocysteine nucleosidase